MTADEARQCVHVLIAGYPRWEPEEGTVLLLANALCRYDLAVGMAAVRSLVESDDRLCPALNRVVQACQQQARRAAVSGRALPPPRDDDWRERGRQKAATIREQLRGGH